MIRSVSFATSASVIVSLPASCRARSRFDELGAQKVDLAVKDASTVRDVLLFGGEFADQSLQLGIAHRADV